MSLYLVSVERQQGFLEATSNFCLQKMLQGWFGELGYEQDNHFSHDFESMGQCFNSTFELSLLCAAALTAFWKVFHVNMLVNQFYRLLRLMMLLLLSNVP